MPDFRKRLHQPPARACHGFGAGRLSWQLGHMSFARVQDDAIYMGLHQALTGVRGLIMPLVGALL